MAWCVHSDRSVLLATVCCLLCNAEFVMHSMAGLQRFTRWQRPALCPLRLQVVAAVLVMVHSILYMPISPRAQDVQLHAALQVGAGAAPSTHWVACY